MIIKHLLMTEKAVRLIEKENTLTFIVDEKARKEDIKKEVERLFNVKVKKVRTCFGKRGKKAYVRLEKDYKAMDVATQMGMI
ncbi:50S ribosomal protein L23 [Nanoarchaeota archaeon]|nr:MAG: 50S ribosomal protein L23 [Nanoarchaeota archaeon]